MTGKYPQEHGIVAQAMVENPRIVIKYKNSICFSPSGKIGIFFEKYIQKKWIDEIMPYTSIINKSSFALIHLMDLHDLIYDDYAEEVSKKLIEKRVKIKAPNPSEKNKYLSNDEWWQLYESTARVLDEKIAVLLNEIHKEDTTIILTSDHGEHVGGEHAMLVEETLHVPLIIDDGEKRKIRNITEHKDLLFGLKEKEYFIAAQKHWLKQEVAGDKTHKVYVTYNHRAKRKYTRIFGLKEKDVEPDERHVYLLRRLIEYSESFDNPIKHGIPYYLKLKFEPNITFLKKWLKGFGFE